MQIRLLLALPMAFVWIGITSKATIDNVILGYFLSLGVLTFSQLEPATIRWQRIPAQLIALVIYVGLLFRDIFLSGVDVARRVLSPTMPLHQGVVAVRTQDKRKTSAITGLSSVVISLTPGELVVEIDEESEDEHIMYVHALDAEVTAANADRVQARRLGLLNRIVGRSS